MQQPGTQHLPSCQPGLGTPHVPLLSQPLGDSKLKTEPFCSEPLQDAALLRGLGGGEPCCPPCLTAPGMHPHPDGTGSISPEEEHHFPL